MTTDLGPIDDESLVATLPGFADCYADVNGVRLHYVEGGSGKPLFLLPGWPQTWWQFSRVMPQLAEHYHVIAVDLRGMGSSGKPASGYDKKTMAADIVALADLLKLDTFDVAGNDIGSMVAYSLAANYSSRVTKLVMMDAPHPFAVFRQIPVLPGPGTYDLDSSPRNVHPWWFAFHQIPALPQAVFAGRYNIVQDWLLDYLAYDPKSITPHDRAVYYKAYGSAESLNAVQGWFTSFDKDIADAETYQPLRKPVLGLGGFSYPFLAAFLTSAAPEALLIKMPDTGHWVPDEQPAETVRLIREFLG